MFFWIALVVVAQFLNAVVSLVDKYIVTSPKALPHPFTYAFYISVLSAGSVVVYLFSWITLPIDGLIIPSFANVAPPNFFVLALAIGAGYTFFQALISLFTALRESDPSDVVPVVGAVSAAGTFALSWLFFETTVSKGMFTGFLLLVLGTLLVSHFRFTLRTSMLVLHAGILYAMHYVIIKTLFIVTTFDNGFFWSRLAIAAVALLTLLVPTYYDKVMLGTKGTQKKGGLLLLGNKVLAGLASILVLKAIEFGDVSLVQALGGVQYVFLILLGALFGTRVLAANGVEQAPRDLTQQAISVSVIVLGFFMLFV